jgi:hypothetical protein
VIRFLGEFYPFIHILLQNPCLLRLMTGRMPVVPGWARQIKSRSGWSGRILS